MTRHHGEVHTERSPPESCLIWEVAQPFYKLHCFLAPGNPGGDWGIMLELHNQDAGRENTRGQGREGSILVKKSTVLTFSTKRATSQVLIRVGIVAVPTLSVSKWAY